MTDANAPAPSSAIIHALNIFLDDFENVLGHDWDFTRDRVLDADFIADGATFLNPNVEDESNNWANRGGLLTAYRALVAAMGEARKPLETDDY